MPLESIEEYSCHSYERIFDYYSEA